MLQNRLFGRNELKTLKNQDIKNILRSLGGVTMESIIAVNELVKQYDKANEPAVKGVSFAVNEGDFFAFLGPNGAGKTTTISILTTTLSITSGNVTIAGYDVAKEAKRVRENVGIIFQQPSLDSQLSAEENIRFHVCLYGMFSYRPTFRMMPASGVPTHYIDEAEHVDKVCIINQGKIAISGSPDEMKESLLRQELILDADNRGQLINELSAMGLFHRIDGYVIVPSQDMTPQEIIARLNTKLTVLKIQEPSLEDAYVEYLLRMGSEAA